jgi:G:T-mismatch repair DNA endonuclease (very short patch repair protein)
VPVPPVRPPAVRGRVFRGTWAVRTGVLTPDQLRSAAWRRLRRDVYADAALPVDHVLHVRGVSLIAPPEAAFGGLTAVALWGGREFVTTEHPVEVVVPAGVRWQPGPGVAVRTGALDGDVVHDPPWLRRTGRTRTAVDLIRRGEADDGVVLLDRLVNKGIVQLGSVRDAVAALPRCRGSRLAREVAGLADGLAESPPETRLRLLMMRAGLPTPVAQFRVFDDEGLVARVDFGYPELRLAIEYEGMWHGEAQQVGKDRSRLNRLRAAGWRVVFVTAADMHDPQRLIRDIARALTA